MWLNAGVYWICSLEKDVTMKLSQNITVEERQLGQSSMSNRISQEGPGHLLAGYLYHGGRYLEQVYFLFDEKNRCDMLEGRLCNPTGELVLVQGQPLQRSWPVRS